MTITTLFLIMLAALLGPALAGFRRFPIPIVVGEILGGIILGPAVLNKINPLDPSVALLGNVGLAMLLFVVGTHLPLRDPNIHKAFRRGAIGTLLAFAAAIPLALIVEHLTHFGHPQMLVLLFACSSTTVVMPIILERKLSGKTVLFTTTWVALADAATIVALPLALNPGHLWQSLVGSVVVAAVACGSFFLLRAFSRSEIGDGYRRMSKARDWALDLRMSIVLVLGLSALAIYFGVSILVAGFAAGAAVMFLDPPGRYTNQLVGVAEGYVVPPFFVILGARLNIGTLVGSVQNIELMLLLVAAAVLTHLVVARLIRLPMASGLTAAAQMGLPAALVSLGLTNHTMEPGQGAAIMAAAMIMVISCSIGAALLARRAAAETALPGTGTPGASH